MNCLNCNTYTLNPKFCSKSCSATFNNKLQPRRKPTTFCKCGKTLISKNKRYCVECQPVPTKLKTLESVTYDNLHRSSAYGLVRTNARKIGKELNFKSCVNCGYDKHFEVCHIKAIREFEPSTQIHIINSPKNLIPLCPNCHWEFDHGLLIL